MKPNWSKLDNLAKKKKKNVLSFVSVFIALKSHSFGVCLSLLQLISAMWRPKTPLQLHYIAVYILWSFAIIKTISVV